MHAKDATFGGHHNLHRNHEHQEEEDIDIKMDHYSAQESLGFCLCGSRSSGVFVKFAEAEVFNENNKRLNAGDQILKINDVELTGLTPDQVVRILRNSLSNTGHVIVKVARNVLESGKRQISARRTASNPTAAAVLHSFSDGHLGVYSPLPVSRDRQTTSGAPPTDSPLMLPHYVEVHKSRHPTTNHRLSQNIFSNKAKSLDKTTDSIITAFSPEDGVTSPDSSADSSTTDNTSCTSVKLDTDSAAGDLQQQQRINSAKTANPNMSRGSSVESTPAHHFSPGKLFQYFALDESILNVSKLNVNTPTEDHFHATKPKSLHANDFKALINGSTSKQSSRKQNLLKEELPLVRFDQFTQMTPSPTEISRQSSVENGKQKKVGSRDDHSNCNNLNSKKTNRIRDQAIANSNRMQNACYSVTNPGMTLSPESPPNTT